jgi:hypothetical protein
VVKITLGSSIGAQRIMLGPIEDPVVSIAVLAMDLHASDAI